MFGAAFRGRAERSSRAVCARPALGKSARLAVTARRSWLGVGEGRMRDGGRRRGQRSGRYPRAVLCRRSCCTTERCREQRPEGRRGSACDGLGDPPELADPRSLYGQHYRPSGLSRDREPPARSRNVGPGTRLRSCRRRRSTCLGAATWWTCRERGRLLQEVGPPSAPRVDFRRRPAHGRRRCPRCRGARSSPMSRSSCWRGSSWSSIASTVTDDLTVIVTVSG